MVQVLTWVKAQGFGTDTAVEVVGRWVWITFPTKPDDEIRTGLGLVGFHWNGKRGCWQHPCGVPVHHSPADSWSLREKYGSVRAEELALA